MVAGELVDPSILGADCLWRCHNGSTHSDACANHSTRGNYSYQLHLQHTTAPATLALLLPTILWRAPWPASSKAKTVTATGPFVAQDEDNFNATMADFEQKTGITIQYNGDKNFEADIKAEIEGGTPPDIVDFPQPGLLAPFAKEGKIVDLSKNLNMDPIKANYDPYWI